MNQFEAGPLKSIEDWQHRRQAALDAWSEVAGPLPGNQRRCDLDVRVEAEVDCGTYVRRLLSYASEPGCRTPAYLCLPKLEGPRPAVLCLHGTDQTMGHGTVVGLHPQKQHSRYAAELAERGFVTVAPAYTLMANYQPDIAELGYVSGTIKAVWDNSRALDLLEGLEQVDAAAGFAAIGHSLGGHNSVYTAVHEPRLRVVVSNCGLDSYQDYYDGDIKGWTQPCYMPGLARYALKDIPFDFHDLVGALAPRSCLIIAPLHDDNFKWRSVDAVADAARQAYVLYGATDKLQVEHPDCAHDFPEEMRRWAYEFIEKHLG
jgi:dienelactone hydrolase